MIAALLMAAAVTILEPPKAFQGEPGSATTLTLPLAQVAPACSAMGQAADAGCWIAAQRLIILPREDATFPYDHACWLMLKAHEDAHANGWAPNHPGGRNFTCYPR